MRASERPSAEPDTTDLARACAGDPESFAVLYRHYFPDLVRFLERRGIERSRAEDAAQETLARAFRHLAGFDTSRPLWPWLRTIAVRVAFTEAAGRSGEVLVCDTPDAVHASDPYDAVAARSVLVESLRRLPDRHRDALVMRYVEDRQPADVAAVLGLSRNSFEQLLWRARRGLAREYDRLSGAVLVPLALRARRAAHWVDTRVGPAFSGALAHAADAAVAVTVVVGSVTATVAATSPSPASASVVPTSAVAYEVPSLAGVGGYAGPAQDVVRAAPGRPAAGPAPDGTYVVVDRGVDVGSGAAQSRTRVRTDPTRKGPGIDDHKNLHTEWTDVHNHAWLERNGGGRGYLCAHMGICVDRTL